MGQHSYECYLFHIVVLALMRNAIAKDELSYAGSLPWLLLFLILTGVVAALVSRFISEPANAAIRDGYFKANTPTVPHGEAVPKVSGAMRSAE
jgi:peptidoglycan/LPS O-acetylase OafA/YrhL